jgi:hypothetical protein
MRHPLAALAGCLLLFGCGEQHSATLADASPPSDATSPDDATAPSNDATLPPNDSGEPLDAGVSPHDAGSTEASIEDSGPPPHDSGGDSAGDSGADAQPDAAAQDASYGSALESGVPCGAFENACGPSANGAPSFCGSVPASWHEFASATDALPYLERTWLLCTDKGIFGIAGEVGFNLGADGTYHVLVETPSGELVTSPDPEAVGTYAVQLTGFAEPGGPPGGAYTPGAPIELSFTAPVVSPVPISGVLTDSPPMMVLSNYNGTLLAYVPQDTAGWPVVGSTQPSPGTGFTAPAVCGGGDAGVQDGGGDAGAPDAAIVLADGGAALVGDWISCDAPALVDVRADFAGLRIDASGTFEVLVWDGAGQIAPASDIFDSGWWCFAFGPSLDFEQLFNENGWYPVDPATLPDRLTLGTGGTPSVFVRRELTGL